MKTNKEYKRRFPWFSASLGVIAVASVATLFVSGQLNAGQGEFGLFVTRALDRISSAHAVIAQDGVYSVSLADAGREDGLVVSGYPSYASATLPLVRDQQARAVRLVLTGRQDVSDEAVAALRITVNGRRVIERVLAPGHRDFNWVFDLTEMVAGDPEARIAVQMSGDVSAEVCHNDRSMGAVLSLDPASGLEIELGGPLTSVRDVLALTPRRITLAVDEGEAWFELAVRLGARLTRNGYRVDVIDLADASPALQGELDGLMLAGSREALMRAGFNPTADRAPAGASLWRRAGGTMIAITDPDRTDAVRFLTSELAAIARGGSVDPVQFETAPGAMVVSLEALGVDTSLQQVADRREWRFDYALSQAPEGGLASAVGLDFRLPDGPSDVTYSAHVALNGELIDSRRLRPNGADRYLAPLPAGLQGLENEVSVALQRHRDEGGCEIAQQRYPLQLSGDSALVFDAEHRGAGFTALPQKFAQGVEVRLPRHMSGEERRVAARTAAETLGLFAPVNAPLHFVFADSDQGRSGPALMPFIAINTLPDNAQTPFRVYADRLVMDAGDGRGADVRALSNLALLQAAQARVQEERAGARPYDVPGLVVHAIDQAPSLIGAELGPQFVAIVHADGEAMSPGAARVADLSAFER